VTLAPFPVLGGLLIWGAGRGPWTSMKIAGLIITVAATVLLTVARVNLGDSFSVAPEAKALVKNGVYSRIRHPVYVFSALIICGLALYFDVLLLLILPAVVVPVQVVRARKEEQLLEKTFGEEYRAYKSRTWF